VNAFSEQYVMLWARSVDRETGIDLDVNLYTVQKRFKFWREYGAAFDLISEDNTVRIVVALKERSTSVNQ